MELCADTSYLEWYFEDHDLKILSESEYSRNFEDL